jgi:hypothetical protein
MFFLDWLNKIHSKNNFTILLHNCSKFYTIFVFKIFSLKPLIMRFKLLLFSVFASGFLYGQTCGTRYEDQLLNDAEYRIAAAKSSEPLAKSRATLYVPITFHLVASSSGTNRLLPSNVVEMLDGVNTYYKDQNIVFYIKNFNNINSDNVNNTPAANSALTAMYNARDGVSSSGTAGSLNCFVTAAAETGGTLGGTTLGYYSFNEDWVVLKKDQVSKANSSTAAHEYGHFFSLKHPFFGWDGEAYDITKHGACVGALSPGGNQTENVPRTGPQANCTSAGDLLCDTEADYNEGFNGPKNCTYTGVAKDRNCVKLITDPKNIMSYFSGCGFDYIFSPQQQALIQSNYLLSSRRYIRNAPSPGVLPVITGATTLKLPLNGALQQPVSNVNLDWDDLPNATNYIIEMDRNVNFDVDPVYYLSSTSNFTVPGPLVLGRKYHWRVIGYNAGNYKGTLSSVFNFTTGAAATETISSISQMTISPNPITNGVLRLNFTNTSAFDGKIKITDITGKVLKNITQRISEGNYNENIDIQNLANGMYILSVENEQEINTERFVINK